ncbi:DUF1444 family protein [Alteromonas macleodii]|uniref:DUF1444 family protein n=1 Tax=Alteromonas macleodii TaxID=28108 RepID=UPI003BF772A9
MKIIIIAFVWLFVSSSFAEIVLDESAFTQRYAKAINIREDGVRADIKGRLEVEMTYSNGETSTAYLDNAYMNYRSSPGELDVIINAYINALTKSSSDVKSNIEKEHIFPVIKDRGYMEQITKLMNHSSKGELPFYYEKLNDVLYVLYAIDTPSSIKFMPKKDINALGVEEGELRNLSMANLMKANVSLQIQGDRSTISMVVADGIYEASFLLYDDLWTKENFPVKGDIVVYVPSRDVLIVTGSEDTESLETARGIVHNPESQWSHAVTDIGFVREKNKWVEFHM